MDAKTYEFMDERIKKYKECKIKKRDTNEALCRLDTVKVAFITDRSHYINIPEATREEVVVAIKDIFERYLQQLEQQMEEI